MSRAELAAIRRRWSTYGGMGNTRGAEDYTDAGCRIFAEHGFRDVAVLLAEIDRLRAAVPGAQPAGVCETCGEPFASCSAAQRSLRARAQDRETEQ